jgi:Mg2+/Co2+ transporter CorB
MMTNMIGEKVSHCLNSRLCKTLSVAWPLIRILELEEDRIAMIHTHNTIRQNHETLSPQELKTMPLSQSP